MKRIKETLDNVGTYILLRVLNIVGLVMCIVLLPMWPVLWLFCRLTSEQCPKCGSKWQTELTGEWDGEEWKCYNCNHTWITPYKRR